MKDKIPQQIKKDIQDYIEYSKNVLNEAEKERQKILKKYGVKNFQHEDEYFSCEILCTVRIEADYSGEVVETEDEPNEVKNFAEEFGQHNQNTLEKLSDFWELRGYEVDLDEMMNVSKDGIRIVFLPGADSEERFSVDIVERKGGGL